MDSNYAVMHCGSLRRLVRVTFKYSFRSDPVVGQETVGCFQSRSVTRLLDKARLGSRLHRRG